jgi:hypothetical protein
MNPGTCINWTGWRDAESRCKAGFKYREIVGPEEAGAFLRLPCRRYDVRPADKRGTYVAPGDRVIRVEIERCGVKPAECACYIEPTDEQIERDRVETEAHLQKTFAAIRVASQWRVKPKPKQDRREIIACPICAGKLHLSQSAYNGHVHGQCETANCVSWME